MVVERRASPVPLNELNIGWVDAAAVIGALHRQQLAAGVRLGFAGQAARRGAPANYLGIDRQPSRTRIGGTHQDDHSAALAGQVATRVLVVDTHVARGEQAGLCQADQLERVQADLDTTHDCGVQLARHQRRAGGRHGLQRRGAVAVDRVASATEAEVGADRRCDRGGDAASQ